MFLTRAVARFAAVPKNAMPGMKASVMARMQQRKLAKMATASGASASASTTVPMTSKEKMEILSGEDEIPIVRTRSSDNDQAIAAWIEWEFELGHLPEFEDLLKAGGETQTVTEKGFKRTYSSGRVPDGVAFG